MAKNSLKDGLKVEIEELGITDIIKLRLSDMGAYDGEFSEQITLRITKIVKDTMLRELRSWHGTSDNAELIRKLIYDAYKDMETSKERCKHGDKTRH